MTGCRGPLARVTDTDLSLTVTHLFFCADVSIPDVGTRVAFRCGGDGNMITDWQHCLTD